MKLDRRIRESRVRIYSGLRLAGFLAAVSMLTLVLGVRWLFWIFVALALFFAVVTLLEFWNVKRLEKRRRGDARS